MQVLHVVGARPNFMKAAPVIAAIDRFEIPQYLVHTGQHYDPKMSEVFFDQLGLPRPDANLEVGSASHAIQTAQIMMRLESVLLDQRPDLVLVYGDVNSTVSASLVASKMGIEVGHVEAGLRSRDRGMPEELNRLVTDQLSDLLFTPSPDADENLKQEGVAAEKIYPVGNLMIDTLVRLLPEAVAPDHVEEPFILVTLHRPSNVDDPAVLQRIIETLRGISRKVPVVFPIHPRTRQRVQSHVRLDSSDSLRLIDPVGYLEFLGLQKRATAVVTDSGGIQEETTYLGIPCLTVRENTERPITVEMGTNLLVGQDMARLELELEKILQGEVKQSRLPALWDGKAGPRVAQIIAKHLR